MPDALLHAALVLANETLWLQYSDAAGSLPRLDVRVTVVFADGSERPNGTWAPSTDPWHAATRCGELELTLHARLLDGGVHVTAEIFNASDATHQLERIDVTLSGLSSWWNDVKVTTGLRVAYCGAHSRSETSRSYAAPLDSLTDLESWWVGAVSGGEGPGLVIGGAQPERFVTRVRVRRDALQAEFPLEGWALDAGETLRVDPLWIGATRGAAHAALERFAKVLGSSQSARITTSPSGWGSWGHWLERIDAGLMREMVHAIDGSAALRHVVDVVQIDDGWSELLDSRRVSASWRPNGRFPSGLAPLATEIARTGRRCGLWILPFTVNAGSPIVATHPEWLVQDERGAPLCVGGTESYCLDPTHPGAAAWLTALLQRFRDWGVDYVKLDFLRALLAPDPAMPVDSFAAPRRYHAARTRLEAYRAGLSVIRAALGPETTIVACSAPAGAGVGVVDCHRVGPDIERAWRGRFAGVRDAARAVAANWFWQGRTWVNDPDYLLECESEPLTRFWATVVAMSGGSVILSADLSTLDPWAESMLAFVMPPVGRAARPIDLFSRGLEPRRWALEFARGTERWTMLGLLNWGERPIAERISPRDLGLKGSLHVWDAWRQRHSIAEDTTRIPIEAQSAALLRLTPVSDIPTVVGTDVHWAQGWFELSSTHFDVNTGELRIVAGRQSPRRGHVWVWVPRDWTLNGGAVPNEENLVVASLDIGRDVVISFSRTSHAPPERNARAR